VNEVSRSVVASKRDPARWRGKPGESERLINGALPDDDQDPCSIREYRNKRRSLEKCKCEDLNVCRAAVSSPAFFASRSLDVQNTLCSRRDDHMRHRCQYFEIADEARNTAALSPSEP